MYLFPTEEEKIARLNVFFPFFSFSFFFLFSFPFLSFFGPWNDEGILNLYIYLYIYISRGTGKEEGGEREKIFFIL